ncbi:Zinc finger CCHC domain-containing protein 12 [Microtus ochrogaster]|nr:Zinc finger CCHC domain-containing protein 12 [Microtus ochrogaster]
MINNTDGDVIEIDDSPDDSDDDVILVEPEDPPLPYASAAPVVGRAVPEDQVVVIESPPISEIQSPSTSSGSGRPNNSLGEVRRTRKRRHAVHCPICGEEGHSEEACEAARAPSYEFVAVQDVPQPEEPRAREAIFGPFFFCEPQ